MVVYTSPFTDNAISRLPAGGHVVARGRSKRRPRTFVTDYWPAGGKCYSAARCVARDADLAVTGTGARSVKRARLADDGLAGRKPMLLLRMPGLLLRLAERAFCALLLKLPPRLPRFSEPVGTRAPV